MDQIQYETQRQCHLQQMIDLENKMVSKKPKPAQNNDTNSKVDDEEDVAIRQEEEKSKRLYSDMVSDVAATGLNIPASFLKVQKNNECKFAFI